MLALVDVPSARQGKDAFQMPANGQQRWRIQWQLNSQWHKPSRPPDQLRHSIHHRHHRVVAALQDFSVVHQEGIRNRAQPCLRLVVVNCDRLLAQVG